MADLYIKGYAVRMLLEASILDADPTDAGRYYRLEVGQDAAGAACRYSTKDSKGAIQASSPALGITAVDTGETLASEQSATLSFNGAADLAMDLAGRVRPMDRMRVELSNGEGWRLAFDGFVSAIVEREMSSSQAYSKGFTLSAGGLWKFLGQSWFNWQGAVQPGYDIFWPKSTGKLAEAGQVLYKALNEHQVLPGQDIIRLFIETALSLVDLKVGEGPIKPGTFFEFATGQDWKSAFDIAYPMPGKTLTTMRGSLVSIIQTMAQPDIHECLCVYREVNGREKPVIVFRPRPFPGAPGDDDGWKALKVHVLKDVPSSKNSMAQRSDNQRPNAFHWAQGSTSDAGLKPYEQKLFHGWQVDSLSLARYGYSARPVASTMPPLSQIPKDKRGGFVDSIQKLVQRIAYQEAPLPNLWTRTIQLPLSPGIHPGEVIEEYSTGQARTGYVSTVEHRISANPFAGITTIGIVRDLPCTAQEYPNKVRELVKIEAKEYYAISGGGAADALQVKMAICHPMDPSVVSGAPSATTPLGQDVLSAANAHGVPPWVLAHMFHIESSFGTRDGNGGGVMQFLPGTANDLNNQGYTKPFSFAVAKSDPAASLDAAAWYVAKQKQTVDKFCPPSMSQDDRWAWAVYGWNQGLGVNGAAGTSRKWTFTPSDMAMPEYGIFWGAGAMQQAKAQFGGLR